MNLANKVILITGANRGIGRALVEEALARGAKTVYAGNRVALTHPDSRVIPLALDITNAAQIADAASDIKELDVLINNAGVAFFDDLGNSGMIDKHLEVNLYGTYNVIQAFVPHLKRAQGAIVNNISIAALASLAPVASYSISKAAVLSMTQSMRAYLANDKVSVHGILTGPVDTDMNREFDIPKESPQNAARNIFDGIENGDEDIFPDQFSKQIEDNYNNSAVKAMERQNALMVKGQPA